MEANSAGESVTRLAIHLCKDYDVYNPLQRILETLDALLIPLVPAGKLTGALLKRVHDAANGLLDMASIFAAVNASSHQSEALDSYKDRAYSMVVPMWDEVARWMLYLLSFEPSAEPEGMNSTGIYVQAALRMVCAYAKGHAFKEEILSQDITVNVLFILLSQKDQKTGRLWDFGLLTSEADVLCEFLQQYCQSGIGRHAILRRLTTVSRKTRHAVLDAILVRARGAVSNDSNLSAKNGLVVAASVRFVIDTIARLITDETICRTFLELDFLSRLTQDLRLLVTAATPSDDMSFWSDITSTTTNIVRMAINRTPHSSRHVAKIVDAGILKCVSWGFLLYTTGRDPMVDLVRAMLPYLYIAKAVLARHSAPETAGVLSEEAPRSHAASEVWSAWNLALEDSTIAFVDWKDRPIKMCINVIVSRHSCSSGSTWTKAYGKVVLKGSWPVESTSVQQVPHRYLLLCNLSR